jgi:hypothetical protein
MGSALAQHGRPVWSLGGGLVRGLLTLGGSVERLALPEGLGDGDPEDGVRATGLLGGLHVIPGLWSPIAGYGGLLGFLRGARFHLVESASGDPDRIPNLISFPYDWRLSNRRNALPQAGGRAGPGALAQPAGKGVALLQGLPELGSRRFGASGDDRLQACGMRGSDGSPRSAT